MSVRVEFPVFVSLEKQEVTGRRMYAVRSLLTPEASSTGRTFEKALQACRKQLQRRFRTVETRWENIDPLLWLSFNPELTVRTMSLALSDGQRGLLPLDMTVALFDVDDYRYANFPRLEHTMMMPGGLRWAQQVDLIQAELFAVMRQMRKELAPAKIDPRAFAFRKGDFITTLSVSLSVQRDTFDFDETRVQSLFASILGQQKVNGAVAIQQVARNLNDDHPDELKRTLGADPRVAQISEAIFTEHPVPIAIVGKPGVGRTTLLHEAIARHLTEHRQLQTNADRIQRIWHLDPSRVISGMSIIGAWQRRTEAILTHLRGRLRQRFPIKRSDGLYIDNPVALCRIGRSTGSSLTLSTVLRPYVERRDIPVILEASPEQWQRLEELDRPFADLFRIIRIYPPDRADSLRILIQRRDRLEGTADTWISRDAIRRLVELEDRYPSTRSVPGSLVERLERLVDQSSAQKLTAASVEQQFLDRSGLRPDILDTSVSLERDELLGRLRRSLIGQPDAIDALAHVIHTTRAGVTVQGRPAASLLLVGPTGVGKTEAAKLLASTLYESAESLVRLDMNEYVDQGAVRRLIGDLQRPEGQLTGRIRHRPFCVLLLDEIEKAHPSVHDLLLQVLDEGRLTDSAGRVSDFSQAIIVLTSNVGAREVGRQTGFSRDADAQAATYRGALRRAFRPEFINRIDQVVVFDSLAPADIQEIARLQVARLLLREGLLRRTVLVELTPAVFSHVAAAGYDALMGARALKRTLETELVAPIADRLVPIPVEQPTTLRVDVQDGALVMTDAPLPMAERKPWPMLEETLSALDPEASSAWKLEQTSRLLDALNQRSNIQLAATASPEGTTVPEEMLLLSELREHRSDLLRHLEEHEYIPDMSPIGNIGPLWGRAPRTSKRLLKRRSFWRKFHNPGNQQHIAQQHVRSVLFDLMRGEPESRYDYDGWAPRGSLPTLLLRGAAIRRDGPRAAALYLRNLTAAAEGAWEMFEPLLESWRGILDDWNAAITVHHVSSRGTIIDANEQEGTDQIWVLRGPGALELMATESGFHLFYPDDEPTQALQVQLAPLNGPTLPLDALLADWALPPAGADKPVAVRTYCPPDQTSDRGAINDLRSGLVVSFADLGRWMARWMYHALPDGIRLEVEP